MGRIRATRDCSLTEQSDNIQLEIKRGIKGLDSGWRGGVRGSNMVMTCFHVASHCTAGDVVSALY